MKNRLILGFAVMVASMFIVGCNDTQLNEVNIVLGESVERRLSLNSGAMESGTDDVSTRSIDDGTDINEFEIENLWVIQFDANDQVVGSPQYISDYSESSTVTLLTPSQGETHHILYMANTYNSNFSIQVMMSMDDVLSLSKVVEQVSHCVNYEENEDGIEEIRLMTSGMTSLTYTDLETNGYLPTCTLKSGVAKITISLTTDTNLTNFEITSIQMSNVCSKLYYYYSDEDRDSDSYPTFDDFEVVDYPYVEEDKDSYTFYVPMNCRGVRSDATTTNNAALKPHYAQTKDTYASVHTLINDEPYDYKFYLGANLIDDFNLRANHTYTYNITFSSTGEYTTDSRISSYGDYDYTIYPSSNCYILNPSPTSSREYLIPVGERVNDYWTNYNSNSDNRLTESDSWTCELIWSDAESITGTDGSQISFTQDPDNPLAMKVSVPAGLNDGNFVVGVKKTGGSDYLWSWHFWMTDYCPNDVAKVLENYDGLLTEFRYGVTGGEVHKYSTAGETVSGEICYIMDRAIGARSIDINTDYKGVLLYQFGRKDPFVKSTVSLNSEGKITTQAVESSNTMEYSIYNPATFLTSNASSDINVNDWEGSKDEYKATDVVWNDKNVALKTGGKSIFDPSPHGWRIPETNAFERASTTYGSLLKNTSGSEVTYYYSNKSNGTVSLSNYLAKFPSYGMITGSTGVFSASTVVRYWLNYVATHTSYVGYGYSTYLNGTSAFVTSYTLHTKATGLTVRPIYNSADFVKNNSEE